MLPRSGPEPRPRSWVRSTTHENSRYLQIDRLTGLTVRYVGPGETDAHAACTRTSDPAADPFFYFEIEVLNRGRDGFIGEASLLSPTAMIWQPQPQKRGTLTRRTRSVLVVRK